MRFAPLIFPLPALAVGAESLNADRARLAGYRAELDRLRTEFGGTRDLPDERLSNLLEAKQP